MKEIKRCVVALTAILLMTPTGGFAANHRSAPITALDHPAGITDWYAFVSPDNPNTVTFVMDVDPLLEPSNGPNYFPFDPNVTYTMKIDNTYDGAVHPAVGMVNSAYWAQGINLGLQISF